MKSTRLAVATDRSQLPSDRDLVTVIGACLEAGLSTVILRELDLPRPGRIALAAELSALGAQVIAAHEALPTCAGVHLPAGAPAGPGAWGRSCHSAADVSVAAAEGASWATLSPFAPTASKPGYGPPLERSAYAAHAIQTFALGGVTPANADQAILAGAHGVVVMGSVMRSDRPEDVIAALLRAIG
jgi:thiamine-phosphate pyrophosphorylase